MAILQFGNKFVKWLKEKTKSLLERRWLNLGLRGKMGALVTIGMLGLMTIFGLLAISSARHATEQVLNERLLLTRMTAVNLDTMLLHILDDLELFAQSPEVTDLIEQGTEQDVRIQQLAIFHRPIYYFNTSQELLATTATHTPDIPWSNIPAIQSALEDEESLISSWSQYQPGTVILATPIKNSSGQVLGALATLLNLSDPLFIPEGDDSSENGADVVDLIDLDGRVVFSNRTSRVGRILTEELILTQLFQNHQEGVETCIGCPGTRPEELSDEVVAFAPLSSVPLGVVSRQPAEEVFSSVRRLFIWHTLWGLVSMAGAIGLVWATTNSVIDPIKTLNEAAERIAEGDLATPIDPLYDTWPINQPRRDEIGVLGDSFDSMRMRLKASLDEVQALNRELDARVQRRTAQAIQAQKEAQAARDNLQSIIDALSDEMIVINVEDQRIVQVNRACREKYASLGDITNLNCFELFHEGHPCDKPDFKCPLQEVVETESPVRVTRIHADPDVSKPAYLEMIASPLIDERGKVTRIVEMVRDVTEERLISESLVQRNQQLAILNAIATTVSKSLDIKEILSLALKEVLEQTVVEAGAIFLIEDVLGQLDLVAHLGLSEEAAKMVSQLGMLDGGCGGVVDHGQLVVVPDIFNFRGPRTNPLRKEKLATLVHIPLTTKGYTLGSMCVGTRQHKEFGDQEKQMFMAIGKQIAVAVENARLYAELQQKEQVRRELFRKAINAQEEERKRIARELHDDTSQALTALMFAAEEGLEIKDLDEVKRSLERMHNLTRQTLDGVHKLLFELRPSMLDHLGLMPAIRWFAKYRLEPIGVRVNFQQNNDTCRLYPETEIALFRVIQEAITNIARHAGARNVEIRCALTPNQAEIEICDDGVGFDPSEVVISPDTGHGLGLLGMSERLELVGGDFEIHSIPGQGTQIDIHVPLHGDKRRKLGV